MSKAGVRGQGPKSRGQGSGVREGHFVCHPTKKGFRWGPVEIERVETEPDDISGAVSFDLKTVDVVLEIDVSRAGVVNIYVPEDGMVIVRGAGRAVPR